MAIPRATGIDAINGARPLARGPTSRHARWKPLFLVALLVPGVSSAQTVVYQEDFENTTNETATGAQSYTVAGDSYSGTTPPGQTYTASAAWLDGMHCNGVVLSANNSTQPTWATAGAADDKCRTISDAQSYAAIRTIARGMGAQFGGGDGNHVVSAFTECPAGSCSPISSGPTNGVMFQTTRPIPVGANRYYTVAVDVGAANCAATASTTPGSGDPQYQFQLIDSLGATTNMGSPVNPCTVGRGSVSVTNLQSAPFPGTKTIYTKSLTAGQAIKYTGSSLGVKMYNVNGVTLGNDGAFDNIRVLDVTPGFSKSFSPSTVAAGGTVLLTFTVTNTSDNLAKAGWEFTDNLAAGLTLANTTVGGTCRNFADTATPANLVGSAGASSFTIRGSLPAVASCTVTVTIQVGASVTSPTLQNCASNIASPSYIVPPTGCATLSITRPVNLTKVWQGATAGDAVSLTLSGASVSSSVSGSSTAPSTTTPDVEQALLGSSVTVAEAFTSGTASNYTTSLACTRASDGVSVAISGNGLNRTITMPLDSGVICTYTNTRQASITIVKDAVPNDAQDFAFTTTGTGLAGFSLDDDADATLSSTRTFSNLAPGSYGVTETAQAGWTLSNLVCVDPDNGSTVNLAGRAATIDLDAGENVTCTFTNTMRPRVTISKVSQGGVGTFSFTGSNGVAAHNITTVTSGVAVSGAAQTLTAASTATTLTEAAPPAGYTLTGIACTGLPAGGAATPNLATRTVTLNAAATAPGANVACTFTNTLQPRITISKVSQGGVGTFSFTGSNGVAAQNITTVTSGVAVSGAAQTLTAASTATTLTEAAPPAGYTLTGIACTGLPAGGAATPNLATRTVTLNAAATAPGANVACTFTNTLQQTDLQVVKTVNPAAATTGQVVTYRIVVSNNGPLGVSNAVLSDTAGAGQDCTTPSTTATCVATGGASCPSATVPVNTLLGSGITIPTLPVGGQVTVNLQCTITASGR